jgi:hypothetical protein
MNMGFSMLGELERLQRWLDNRELLIADFKTLVARSHSEPWPDFVVIGQEYDMKTGLLRPHYKGVPDGSHHAGGGDGPDRPTLVELAARITAFRSRRWDSGRRSVKPISSKWKPLAREAFQFLPSVEIGDGWADLIIAMSGWIAELGLPEGYRADQIKEKYGTLRWYDNSGDEMIDRIVTAGEWLSDHLCDKCGRPGQLREGGWLVTRCDWHA